MRDGKLETWEGIRDVLERLDHQHREPDPWESHFVAQAIVSLGHGRAAPYAIDAALCPVTARRLAEDIVSESDTAITKDALRVAFLRLPVPGGHPA